MIYSHSIQQPTPLNPDFEHVVCDYCGADDTQVLGTLQPFDRLPFPMHRLGAAVLSPPAVPVQFVRCERCSFVYMTPRPTEPAIARFYDKVYAVPGATAPFESEQTERSRYLLDITAGYLDEDAPVSMLDIGCGAGQVLREAQARGWQVHGSELSSVAAQTASERLGVPVHHGDFREMGLTAGALRVVSMLEVMEHLRAPIDFVRDAAALLAPGGVLVIEVPNVHSLEYEVARRTGQMWRGFTIEHLYYFTPDLMRQLMADLGLTVLRLSSRHATTHYPNPLRDLYRMLKPPTPAPSSDQAPPPSDAIPPLPPVSLPVRVLRQLNNYALDMVSAISQGPAAHPNPHGNTLYLWAKKK